MTQEKLPPIHPGEILLTEFLRAIELSHPLSQGYQCATAAH
ncbi:MAG: hypothetical protein R2867_37030 [Caldilineaceae bacterium]